MTMTLTAYTVLIIAALVDYCTMLRWDILMLQQTGYSNTDYNKRLKSTGELTSTKRLLVLAILIGACTSMARMSWIVVLILAAVILAQAIMFISRRRGKQLVFNKRVVRLFASSAVITLLIVELAGYLGSFKSEENAAQDAAIVALTATAVSPLITMVTNRLLQPIERRINK